MPSKSNSWFLVAATAAIVTTATFAKQFVPFYLIGSTPIFAGLALLGLALVAASSGELQQNVGYVREILIVIGLLYGLVVTTFLLNSLHKVPVTYLVGILLFHGLFLLFGFAAARALKAVFAILLIQAAIYLAVVAQYAIRFGDLMRGGYLHDIFGIGASSKYVSTFHQTIGTSLGLAVLALLGLVSNRRKVIVVAVIPFVLLFMFHIASRTAIVSLICGLAFLTWASLWSRARKLALISLAAAIGSTAVFSGWFYGYALHDRHVDPITPNAISRTIKELQSRNPGFRLPIWEHTWHRIASENPDRLALGRGIGTFPIDEGFGPPDWLLRKTEGASHYPHNVHLEMLYEAGIVGLFLFGILTVLPLLISLKNWTRLSDLQRSAISIYLFYLVSADISGSFAFSYDFQFFMALGIGVVALDRKQHREIPDKSTSVTPQVLA